ncbi:MAG: hypothetical protein H6745_01340 [Deltaproteobacteria bacterium]|nr:hypothetical protein [Deltaproteobacteria bacterium]
MRAIVVVRGPDGRETELGHGDLVGRLRKATLRVDDPRVSEAHAMVSLRGETMKLLGLRGRLGVEGRYIAEVALREGLEIELAPGVGLTVTELLLPDELVGLEGDDLVRQPLQGVMSLHLRPRPRLAAGYSDDADAVFWGEEESFLARVGDAVPRVLAVGDAVDVGGRGFRVVAIPLADASTTTTLGASVPVRVVASFDTAEVHQGDAVVLLSGLPARLLSELVAIGGPAGWDVLAGELWDDEADKGQLRARFDMVLTRLRRRLRDAGLRPNLVVSTGTGQVQLVLREGDTVEDRT